MADEKRLPYRCDVTADFDRYHYRITTGQRKCWDGEPDLSEEGWEEWAEWERFDFTEERYWRRPLSAERLAEAQRAKDDRARTTDKLEKERAVIEAAEAWYETWKYALNPASDPVAPPRATQFQVNLYRAALTLLLEAVEALQKARGVDVEPSK